MKKLLLLAIGGVGYVMGTRAGRERYEQITQMATKVRNDPRVKDAAHQAAETAKTQAPLMKDKVTSAADTAADKVRPAGSAGDDFDSPLNPDSTSLQDNPYPQGNLP